MLAAYRVDAEMISSEERSLLAEAKDFSKIKEVKDVDLSAAEDEMQSILQSSLLEESMTRCSRKEEVLRLSSMAIYSE